MLLDRSLPPDLAWNTWGPGPAELVFLPLGLRIAPVLYSAKAGQATAIRAPDGMRFGAHGLRGEAVGFEASHAGTRLAVSYAKPDPFRMEGAWRVLESGEWALRFWVSLCVSADGGEPIRFEAAEGVALARFGARFVALATSEAPVLVTGHESPEALAAAMTAKGYFDKSDRAEEAPTLALRFNLEMSPRLRFAAAVADSRALAVEGARALLAGPAPDSLPPLHEGRDAGALDAVRDVLGWNTVYDAAHRRPMTAASRIWGLGDAVWFNDQCFAALMGSLFDGERARMDLSAALGSSTPQGNVACLVNPKDAWVDRSQAPHGAFAAWTIFLRNRDRALLESAYSALACNHRWWRAHRDPDGRGLVSCGTSAVGDAMYAGTAFGARNESGMDNSATHEEAVYDPETRTLSTLDLGLNCALALDAEMLGRMARELGRAAEAERFEALGAETRRLIRTELWDEARGLFANRQRGGGFVRALSPTSVFPLLCGAADERQAACLLDALADPMLFGGAFVIPNAARNEPAYRENIYWRGRIWPNVNYLVWQGLRRYGFRAEAAALAEKSHALFRQSWDERRWCGENYGAQTGLIDDAPGNDPFYTWGALLPLMAVAEITDVGPWHGWEVTNAGGPVRLGPLATPAGPAVLRIEDGLLTLETGAGPLLATDRRGRLAHLLAERGLVSATLGQGAADGSFRLGPEPSRRLVAARLAGRAVEAPLGADGWRRIDLSQARPGDRLDCHLVPV